MKIKKDDTVLVIAGKDKGKKGKVRFAYPEKRKVMVEGVNFIIRHTRPSQTNPQGSRVEKEAPIHASNVAIVDSSE